MRRTSLQRSSASLLGPAVAALALLAVAGCGDIEVTPKSSATADSTAGKSSPSTKADTSLGEGTWLLGMFSAGGSDAESSTTTYVSYDPSTGEATATKMPAVKAPTTTANEAVLLVSADREWAIPDTGISRAEGRSGRLEVYSLANGSAKVVDIRSRTGRSDVEAIGWAFDPERADTLRVVDTKNRVWAVAVAGGRAKAEASLPGGAWVFANGFNRNTGLPYLESIDSERTKPAGNGPSDTSPVTRSGGTVLPSGTPAVEKLPASPCRLAAGFTEASGTSWVFCADAPSVKAFYLPEGGQEWTAFGKPSNDVAPTTAGFPVVLPPAA